MLAGYRWVVTFSGDVGNMPALVLDSSYVTTTRTAIVATVNDGDNSIDTVTKARATYAIPGELPALYRSAVVGPESRAYTLSSLSPGQQYQVRVSAQNYFGYGPSTASTPSTVVPPMQAPNPPTMVAVNVHNGSSSTLDVSYLPPTSDGGSPILRSHTSTPTSCSPCLFLPFYPPLTMALPSLHEHRRPNFHNFIHVPTHPRIYVFSTPSSPYSYRVEVDTSNFFPNPIATIFPCPTESPHSVFKVQTSGYQGNPVVGGHFALTVTRDGLSFTTEAIPYDAPAMMADEVGFPQLVQSGAVNATLTNGSATFR